MQGFFVNPNDQIPNPKFIIYLSINGLIIAISKYMAIDNKKKYDLKERTFLYAKTVMEYVDSLPKKVSGIEIGRQLIRSAGSVGANYIEADESLSRKDFIMRIKICKKEAKESHYWLELSMPKDENNDMKSHLIDECTQLIKIFATIIKNAS